MTNTPSSASTSPVTSAVNRPWLASIWRASSAPPKVPSIQPAVAENIVDCGGVRLCQFRGINFVMLGDGAWTLNITAWIRQAGARCAEAPGAVRYGISKCKQPCSRCPPCCGSESLCSLVRISIYVESPWEIALGQGGEPAAPILPAPMLEDSKSSCRRLGTAALRQSKLSSWWRTAPGLHPSV
jgi:hypothetical protein